MTAARQPSPDLVVLKINEARAVAHAILDGHCTDRERQLALAVRHLAQALEHLAAEVRR